MIREYTNRYGSKYTFTLQEDGNVLWEGDFKYCRIGFPNDYSKAYEQYLLEIGDVDIEEFKSMVHQYDDQKKEYKYYKYLMLVESLRDEIDMIDPSGGCYLSVGMSLAHLGFKGLKIEGFKSISNGYLIITEKI